MKPETSNVNNGPKLTGRLPADRKKLFVAVGLIAIMAFMWIKVLTGKSSVKDAAAATDLAAAQQQKHPEVEISYIDLPVVAGRNDMLTHDIFDAKGFNAFTSGKNRVDADISNDDHQRTHQANIRKIAARLKISAIITGAKPEAYIEDKLVSVGSTLPVSYDNRIYRFTVTRISQEQVTLKWKDFVVNLKMSQP